MSTLEANPFSNDWCFMLFLLILCLKVVGL